MHFIGSMIIITQEHNNSFTSNVNQRNRKKEQTKKNWLEIYDFKIAYRYKLNNTHKFLV